MELEEIKDEALKSINAVITTETKKEAISFLQTEVMPKVKAYADGLGKGIKDSATGKAGWCYFRDEYFLPGVLSLACYVLDKVLGKMAKATEAEAASEAAEADTQTQAEPTA